MELAVRLALYFPEQLALAAFELLQGLGLLAILAVLLGLAELAAE